MANFVCWTHHPLWVLSTQREATRFLWLCLDEGMHWPNRRDKIDWEASTSSWEIEFKQINNEFRIQSSRLVFWETNQPNHGVSKIRVHLRRAFNHLLQLSRFQFQLPVQLRNRWIEKELETQWPETKKKRINHNFTWTLQNCLDRTSFSSMWIFKCERRVEYLAKLLLQMLHSCGHSSLCFRIWFVRLYFRAKLFLQTVHSCGRTFVWTSSTFFLRVDICRNCFLHMLHPCGFFPVCNKRWAFSVDNALKRFLQMSQPCGRWFLWIIFTCMLRLNFRLNCILQMLQPCGRSSVLTVRWICRVVLFALATGIWLLWLNEIQK